MGMIKEFLRRKEIDGRAAALVSSHFTDLVMKRIAASDDRKGQKKLDIAVQRFNRDAKDYINAERLGVYGKARFLNSVQAGLVEVGLGGDISNQIIKSLV